MAGLGLRKALVRHGALAGTDVDAEVWVSPGHPRCGSWRSATRRSPAPPSRSCSSSDAPALRLDNALGTVALPGSEWVYPDRGLTVFADEEDERVWRVALFTPTGPEEYEERYRVFLGQRRR